MENIVTKIDKMRVARGWTIYKLAQEADISQQTYHQWLDKNTTPSIKALQNICHAFGITMAEMFADGNLVEVTPELKSLYDEWKCLTDSEKVSVKSIIDNFIKNKN